MKKAIGIHGVGPAKGSTHRKRRLGRGNGSGKGTTSGRGQKGQGARSGSTKTPGFEGGQMPLARRVPKRGFTNIFRTEFEIINLKDLNRFEDGADVGPEALVEKGLAGKKSRIKILGGGELEKRLTVSAHAFSASAKSGIEKRGGEARLLR